jgi:hypothetical protein
MESHKIWISNLQDMVMNHVCQGFLKTYNELFRMCKGHKIKISVQTAMEGIPHLSMHKINADYKILLESLNKINFDEQNLLDLIKNCYSSYAISALTGAGIKCEKINAKYLTGPQGSAFIHEIYINVARVIWTNPTILVEKNIELLKLTVKDAVEKSIRDGVNLKFLSTVAFESEPNEPVPPLKRVVPLTMKEKFSNNKSILDDDSDDSIITEEEDDDTNIILRATNIVGIPEMDASNSEMTVDNDDYAPDNSTINIEIEKSPIPDEETISTSQTEYTIYAQKPKTIIDVQLEDVNDELQSVNVKSQSVNLESVKSEDIKDDIPEELVLGVVENVFSTFKINSKDEDSHAPSELNDDLSVYTTDDTQSLYSVTLLSHDDMLSSRLSLIGAK